MESKRLALADFQFGQKLKGLSKFYEIKNQNLVCKIIQGDEYIDRGIELLQKIKHPNLVEFVWYDFVVLHLMEKFTMSSWKSPKLA